MGTHMMSATACEECLTAWALSPALWSLRRDWSAMRRSQDKKTRRRTDTLAQRLACVHAQTSHISFCLCPQTHPRTAQRASVGSCKATYPQRKTKTREIAASGERSGPGRRHNERAKTVALASSPVTHARGSGAPELARGIPQDSPEPRGSVLPSASRFRAGALLQRLRRLPQRRL